MMTVGAPIHPGEHLAEILGELNISQYRLAKAIGVHPRRINQIVLGGRSITADTALRIGRALGMTPEFWLNLQRMYDLDRARATTWTRAPSSQLVERHHYERTMGETMLRSKCESGRPQGKTSTLPTVARRRGGR